MILVPTLTDFRPGHIFNIPEASRYPLPLKEVKLLYAINAYSIYNCSISSNCYYCKLDTINDIRFYKNCSNNETVNCKNQCKMSNINCSISCFTCSDDK